MRPIRVSIIMAARNVGQYVDSTLASLMKQTRLPDEIIVADGRSSDDTVALVEKYADGRVSVKIVDNESLFAGGGRNAATEAAAHPLLVNMDFGNLAESDWLESMVKPFEEDPELDMLGGIFYPRIDTQFERIVAAVCYSVDCLLPAMRRDEIEALIPDNFVPGGMCMAYRRSIWEKAGGFCAWARKGQDRLFGYRVRNVGGKVALTLDAMVLHHMPASVRALVERNFFYHLWAGRTSLPTAHGKKLAVVYGAGFGLSLLAIRYPWLLVPLSTLGLAFVYERARRKLERAAAVMNVRFSLRDKLTAAGVVFVYDVTFLLGRLAGNVDRVLRPGWREKLQTYLEHGK